jgi:hypothetical protein
MLVVGVAVGLVYRAGFGLPFYADDTYHLLWVETKGVIDQLVPCDAFASYRPLQSLLWYPMGHWFGFFSPTWFHTFNLLLHAVNGWLVVTLAWRLAAGAPPAARRWLSWSAGLIFVLYPFSYRAALLVSGLNHLLGAFLVLGAVLLYDLGRRGARGGMVASWLLGFMAPFANEAGLVLAGLIALYEWAAPRLRSRRHLQLVLAYLPGPALYLLVWWGWGGTESAGLVENLRQVEQLFQKVAYFAQGATFPLQFAAARLVTQWGWNAWWALGAGAAVALLVLGVLYARLGWWRRLGLACGWVALTVLPPLVALSLDYVVAGPRLLYIPAIGVACLWGGAVVGLAKEGNPAKVLGKISGRKWIGSLRTASIIGHLATFARLGAALALVLIPGLLFIRQRMDLFALLSRPTWQILEVSRASPDDSLLFVNLPAWVAYKDFTFPVSREGVAWLPSFLSMSDYIRGNTGLKVKARAVAFPSIQGDQPYWYGLWGKARDWEGMDRAIRTSDRVYVSLFQEQEIRLVEAGGVQTAAPAGRPVAQFEGGIRLLDVQAIPEAEGLSAVLIWSAGDSPQVGDTVFVHLLDSEERLIGQADGLPLVGMFPFWLWQPGDVVRDVRWMPVPGGLEPGRYAIRMGMYKLDTGERRAVWGADGARFADDVVPALVFDVGP